MSLRAIELEPSADIHLAVAAPFQSVTLRVRLYDEAAPPLLIEAHEDPRFPGNPGLGFEIDGHDHLPDAAGILDNGEIRIDVDTGEVTGLSASTNYLWVFHQYRVPVGADFNINKFRVPVRVIVHDDLPEIWIGNSEASVNAGADNLVVTVFAKNGDDEIVDVTAHGFVRFEIAEVLGGDASRAHADDLDETAAAFSATDEHIEVLEPASYRDGDLVLVPRTGERMRVIGPAIGSTIPVQRGVSSTASTLAAAEPLWNAAGVDPATGRVRAALGLGGALGNGSEALVVAMLLGDDVLETKEVTVTRSFDDHLGESAEIASSRAIVEEVGFRSGGSPPRRHILFVAEGFESGDHRRFDSYVRRVAKRLQRRRAHQPFRLLREDYRIWKAFPPSAESGIAVNTRVGQDDGKVENDLTIYPNRLLLQLPDTPFGLCYGRRAGEIPFAPEPAALFEIDADVPARIAELDAGGAPSAALRQAFSNAGFALPPDATVGWVIPGTKWVVQDAGGVTLYRIVLELDSLWARAPEDPISTQWRDHDREPEQLLKDWRRVGSDRSRWHDEALSWLAGLRRKDAALGHPDWWIGQTWRQGGPDQGLVIFVVNGNLQAGTYTRGDGGAENRGLFAAVTISNADHFTLETRNDRFHVSGATAKRNWLSKGMRELVGIHELAHAFFLGDEYEDREADPRETHEFDNLDTETWIVQEGATKWSQLPRVAKSATVRFGTTVQIAGRISVPVFPGEEAVFSPGQTALVCFQSRNINPASATEIEVDPTTDRFVYETYPAYRAHPFAQRKELRVAAVDVAGSLLELEGDALEIGDDFPTGSMIFEPLIDPDGQELSLVLPAILDHMNTRDPNLPAAPPRPGLEQPIHDKDPHNNECAQPDETIVVLPSIDPKDHGLKIGKRQRLIGLYEGGGHQICGVFRPSGECMMRNQFEVIKEGELLRKLRFCHVCRYVIVNEINPSRHPELDALYPGAPL